MKSFEQNTFDLKEMGVEEISDLQQNEINGGLSIALPSLSSLSLPSVDASAGAGLNLAAVLGGLTLGLGINLGLSVNS
ncbi:hypothetical protein DN752_09795 [Echinicola strongylocentroti]|uniref:Uncharacterized protein n=1 Tax=Echinicola strongylocentroti TaxID=1795355 RepID=A0A2Z4II25_9BACT|nr:hypothetical protein [Echinicola strongylocentroti]AWW30389.1 hypothetical protein DN752_09795 [Echinicola strongylocentroti]